MKRTTGKEEELGEVRNDGKGEEKVGGKERRGPQFPSFATGNLCVV